MDNLRVAKVDNVILERYIPPNTSDGRPVNDKQTGTLHLTPHHLIFSPPPGSASASTSSNTLPSELWIPYPSITLLQRLPQAISGLYPLQIRTRSFDSYVMLFEKDREGGAEDVWQSVKDCAVATSVEQLYAFFYALPPIASGSTQPKPPLEAKLSSPLSLGAEALPAVTSGGITPPQAAFGGWGAFQPRAEFARQGLGTRTKAWRFTDINKDYGFCPTYPNKLVVPSRISDSTLSFAGKYRSKGRIPALTYLHWANHASITRSSQPMVGLKQARSAHDERLVECIFSSHSAADSAYATPSNPLSPSPSISTSPSGHVYGATTTNLIIDARPTANAMANTAVGAGTENMENYKTAKKAYLGIDNIHVMRNSLKTIAEAIKEVEDIPGSSLDRGILRKSNWLKHISTLLDGSLVIIKNVHLNASHVLIHCSDGWDRTSQLSAIAQVCLDPYYRTFEGFKILIEKDWLAFGHKFLDRSGHLSSEKHFTVAEVPDEDSDEEGGGGAGVGASKAAQAFLAWGQKQFRSNSHVKEISPVFHQFLDCVYQIQRQYPNRFEFNEDYLLDLHYHLYACQFGTFLFNNERERRIGDGGKKACIERTVSSWDWFDRPEIQSNYLNAEYDSKLDDRESRLPEADQGVLIFDPRDVRFWHKLFKRGDEEMNGSKVALAQAIGADFVTVSAGQVDPVSVEGAIDDAAAKLRGADTLGASSPARSRNHTPNPDAQTNRNRPASQSIPGNIQGSSSSPAPKTRDLPENGNSQGNRISGVGWGSSGGGGWNWSKVSSGAFSALSGAAREIKSIGSEAMNQIRQEANEVQDEMWTRGEKGAPGTGIGEGRIVNGGASSSSGARLPRVTGRIPSEANPWSTESRLQQSPSASLSRGGGTEINQVQAPLSAKAVRQPSWNTNPWDDRPSAAIKPAAAVIQEDTPDALAGRLEELSLPGKTSTPNIPMGKTKEDEEKERKATEDALGGDRKAWDPLGAL